MNNKHGFMIDHMNAHAIGSKSELKIFTIFGCRPFKIKSSSILIFGIICQDRIHFQSFDISKISG